MSIYWVSISHAGDGISGTKTKAETVGAEKGGEASQIRNRGTPSSRRSSPTERPLSLSVCVSCHTSNSSVHEPRQSVRVSVVDSSSSAAGSSPLQRHRDLVRPINQTFIGIICTASNRHRALSHRCVAYAAVPHRAKATQEPGMASHSYKASQGLVTARRRGLEAEFVASTCLCQQSSGHVVRAAESIEKHRLCCTTRPGGL
ncbi:hypothetical protein VTN96DRAFT_5332 [Rasamsonia emersonii]